MAATHRAIACRSSSTCTVLALALGAAWGLWRLWSGTWALMLTEDLDDKARFEVAKIVLAIVGGLGGVVFLTIGYRKQRDGEAAERRNDAAEAREQSKHFHERFGVAAEQLGSGAPRVRLAGVYAMAALADDWDAGRQTCINVLCGYIRAPYEPPRDLDNDPTDEALKEHRAATEEREIRRAILDTTGERLRTKPRDGKTWHGYLLSRQVPGPLSIVDVAQHVHTSRLVRPAERRQDLSANRPLCVY